MIDLLRGLTGFSEAVTPAGVRLCSADIPAGGHDDVWGDLLARHPESGWYPVMGPDAEGAVEAGRYFDVQGPAALRAALTIDPADRFEQLRLREIELSVADQFGDEEDSAYWRDKYDPAVLAAKLDGLTGPGPGARWYTESYPPGSVLLVPAAAGYEIPVLVPGLIRANNTDLGPTDHLAVLRHWHQRYGAELFRTAGSNLELTVTRPPVATADIARAAVEQFVYNEDLYQKLGELQDVAVKQVRGHHWSFWWD